MNRLTRKDWKTRCYDSWELCGMSKFCTKGCHEEGGCIKGCPVINMYMKLAAYEDLLDKRNN